MTGGFLRSLTARHSGRINTVHPRMPSVFETSGRRAQSIIPGGTWTPDVTPVITRNPDEIRIIERPPVMPPVNARHRGETRDIGNAPGEYTQDVSVMTPGDGTNQTGSAPGEPPRKSTRKPQPDRETNIPEIVKPSSAKERGPRVEIPRESIGKPNEPARESRPTPGAETPVLREIPQITPSGKEKKSKSPGPNQVRESSRRDALPGVEKDIQREPSPESLHEYPRLSQLPVTPVTVRLDEAAAKNPDVPRQRTEFTPVHVRSLRPGVLSAEVRGNATNETTTVKEPTVHVTIGRIEVRAVPPPVLHQKEQVPRALTRLDEYLKRRDEGDRR